MLFGCFLLSPFLYAVWMLFAESVPYAVWMLFAEKIWMLFAESVPHDVWSVFAESVVFALVPIETCRTQSK